MNQRVLFGTDGVRGEANLYPMTVEVAMALGSALAQLVCEGRLGRPQKDHRQRIVIGKDTRLSGYCFEQAIAAGICSMGVDVMLVGPLPTPGIAFITESMRADAGIVVSASHNGFEDNGIKVFGHDGFKLPDDVELELETLILTNKFVRPTGTRIGRAKRIDDAMGRYVVYLKSLLFSSSTLDGLTLALDAAHGAAYKAAPLVFEELGAKVHCIGNQPNGLNINDGVGSLYPEPLRQLVLEKGAHVGIALDGDADRVVLIDEKGAVVDGDALLAVLAADLKRRGQLPNDALVATEMSNLGLEQAMEPLGIKVHRTKIGDRYVVECMREQGLNFGGEQSGHLLFLDHGTTGDGLAAALMVVRMMIEQQKPLSELCQIMKPLPRSVRGVQVPVRLPLEELRSASAAIKRIGALLGATGRVFVRHSGTEKKIRVLVEGQAQADVDAYADEIVSAIKADMAAALA